MRKSCALRGDVFVTWKLEHVLSSSKIVANDGRALMAGGGLPLSKITEELLVLKKRIIINQGSNHR